VQPGRGLGANLMAEPAIMARLRELAGFALVLGTLNVHLPGPIERGSSWRYVQATELAPDWEERTGQAGCFLAAVLIAGSYRGLAFQGDEQREPGYPPDQIELLSEVHLRDTLGLQDGDSIVVSFA